MLCDAEVFLKGKGSVCFTSEYIFDFLEFAAFIGDNILDYIFVMWFCF